MAAGARKSSLKIRNSSLKSKDEFKANTLPDGGGKDKTSVVHTGTPTRETKLAGPIPVREVWFNGQNSPGEVTSNEGKS
jgi:hypothetical protein